MLSLQLISQAVAFLEGRLRVTPIELSRALSELLGVPVYLKLECLQVTGSFKIRGAWFRLSQLGEEEKARGIITCSAGNHGRAVAYAARELGIQATIYVPKDVDEVKYAGMLALGAKVIRSKYPGYDETEDMAIEAAQHTGQPFISAFDDPLIMAGNGGSLAAEVLAELPDAETFLLPVGGGGLSAGFAYYAREMRPQAQIIGCQHRDSPALQLSLERGEAVTSLPFVQTLAGGIEGGIGTHTFAILKDRVAGVALVREREILEGVRWMLSHHQYLIEPTAAVVIAACLGGKLPKPNGKTVAVLSGRNVSLSSLQRILG